jgi:adenine-specific DNA-methyltransferase
MILLRKCYYDILDESNNHPIKGFISELYAPKDDKNIKADERVFYTSRNAMYIDTVRQIIGKLPQKE